MYCSTVSPQTSPHGFGTRPRDENVGAYLAKGQEKRKAQDQDIDKMDAQMQRGFKFHRGASGKQEDMDLAAQIQGARAAAEMNGDHSGAFGDQGTFHMNVPNVKDLQSEGEDTDPEDAEAKDGKESTPTKGKGGGGGSNGSSPKGEEGQGGGAKDASGSKDAWFDCDTQIGDATKAHKKWMKETKKQMVDVSEDLKNWIKASSATPEMYEELKNDIELARGRRQACILVMKAKAEPQAVAAEGSSPDSILTADNLQQAIGASIEAHLQSQSEPDPSLATLGAAPKAMAKPKEPEPDPTSASTEPAGAVVGTPGDLAAPTTPLAVIGSPGGGGDVATPGGPATPATPLAVTGSPGGGGDVPAAFAVSAGAFGAGGSLGEPRPCAFRPKVGSDGGNSFLQNLLAQSGQNPTLAVKKYKATLDEQQRSGEKFRGYGLSQPIRSFRDLRHYDEFDALFREYELCSCKEDIQRVNDSWKAAKGAFKELVTNAKGVQKRLENGVKKFKEGGSSKKKAKTTEARKTIGKRSAAAAAGQEAAEPAAKRAKLSDGTDSRLAKVAEVALGDDLKLQDVVDWQKPALFHVAPPTLEAALPLSIVACRDKSSKFLKSEERNAAKRTHRKLDEDSVKELRAFFKFADVAESVAPPPGEALSQAMTPSFCAVAGGTSCELP